ncbi:MAG: hypothetical protein ACRDPM_10630 [Solirubrobacteraceae bacterium]
MQISIRDSLLGDEWRAWVRDALVSIEHVGDDETGVLAVRAARATAVIAASECAQAARFAATLITLGDDELDAAQREVETRRKALECDRIVSLLHLDSAIDDLVAELRAQLAIDSLSAVSVRGPYQRRLLGEDLAAILGVYADRVEELVLEIGEVACSVVGTAMGGLLPLRASQLPPCVGLGMFADGLDAATVGRAIHASIAPYRDRLSAHLDILMRWLCAGIDAARECHRLGDGVAHARARSLAQEAEDLAALAQSLDWLPVAPR